MKTNTFAIVISNEGKEVYNFSSIIDGQQVFEKTSNTDSYLIGTQKVTKKTIETEINMGIASKDFSVLL